METLQDLRYETSNCKLIAFLDAMGYDIPAPERRGRRVIFIFSRIQQDDILRFLSEEPAYVSPLQLLMRYDKVLTQVRELLREPAPPTILDVVPLPH
jgi:hypothetical protein